MFCPNCQSEYREGFTRCADCDVDLIEALPDAGPDERPQIELVKIYEGGDPATIPVLESLLDDAGIEYSTSSEAIQDLFGWGRFPGTYNFAIGPIKFFVRREDEAEALAIVAQLREGAPPLDEDAPQLA